MTQSTKEHWNTVYQNKAPHEVSWFQPEPTISIDLVKSRAKDKTAAIIDVGGGDSLLVDYLLEEGYTNLTVLDISEQAIAKAKHRLGDQADKVKWIVSDVLDLQTDDQFDVWHDRAAFHFITSTEGIETYSKGLEKYVTSNGSLILGTFSTQGPEKCSGIPIKQYSEDAITAQFEPLFNKESCIEHNHLTPFDTLQHFIFCTFKKQ